MKGLEQILKSIEDKKRELMENDERYFGCDTLERATPRGKYGGSPIRGFNAPFDPYDITEHLTDEEFRLWYSHGQRTVWHEFKEEGVKEEQIKCLECNQKIEKPEDMIRWAAMVHHGGCLIQAVDSGKFSITDFQKPFYERLKRVVFGKI